MGIKSNRILNQAKATPYAPLEAYQSRQSNLNSMNAGRYVNLGYRISVVFILIFLSASAFGQRPSIPISEKKETVGGKTFYLHTVEKGQTVYSIAAAYNLQTSDIAEFNEDVFDGIEEDEVLKIPLIKGKNATMEEIVYHKEFQFHYVEKGETLYSIIGKYKSNETLLKKWNPGLSGGLKVGMVLRIPRKGVDLREAEENLLNPKPELPAVVADANHFVHVVVKGETLYSLSRKYDIPLQKLIDINPGTADGIAIGEKLRIPKEYNEKKDNPVAQKPAAEGKKSKPCKSNYNFNPKDTFQVALLLPFYLAENERATIPEPVEENDLEPAGEDQPKPVTSQVLNKSKVFLEFYEGFLLGLENVRKKQIPVHLRVFDTSGRLDSLIKIVRNPVLQKQDLVIGPAYDATIREFNKFSLEYGVNFIPPLLSAPDGLLESNQHMIQVIPSTEAQIKDFSEVIANYYDYNIVIIHFNTDQEKEVVDMFNKYLTPALKKKSSSAKFKIDIQNKSKAYQIEKPENEGPEEIFNHPLKRALSQEKPNLVILPSRDQGIVSNTIRELNMIANEKASTYEITLCGFQNARNFENIDMEDFYNLQFHTFTGFYVDYARPEVKDFVLRFRELYDDEPSQFAFQGYDIAVYFLSAMRAYGPDFQDCLTRDMPEFTEDCLQNEFIFKRSSEDGGIENKQTTILKYGKDYSINRIDPQYLPRLKRKAIPTSQPSSDNQENQSGSRTNQRPD